MKVERGPARKMIHEGAGKGFGISPTILKKLKSPSTKGDFDLICGSGQETRDRVGVCMGWGAEVENIRAC